MTQTRRRNDSWRTWILVVMGIALCISGGAALAATSAAREAKHNSDRLQLVVDELRRIEIKDRDVNRATAYRLCSRNAVDRAFAHSAIRQRAGEKAMIAMQDYRALAILNCKANLYGKAATPMEPEQHIAFVNRWERQKLTPEELGICPNTPIGTTLKPGDC